MCIIKLFAEARGKSATVKNDAVSGFAKARINPFRLSTSESDDEEFLGAAASDIRFHHYLMFY